MTNSYSFDRTKFLQALQQWCSGKYDPLVAFPDKRGFLNTAYLYDNNYKEIIEESHQAMQYIQAQIGMPVMIFAEPRSRAKEAAFTCSEWLKSM